MSDKQFSLFELHFHEGVQIGPKTLGGLPGEAESDDAELDREEPSTSVDAEAGADDGGPALVRRLVGLGVLAAAAYAAKKLLDGRPEGFDALDDIEDELDDIEEAADDEDEEAVSIEVTSGEDAESGGSTGLVVAGVVALLVILALAARKLLGGTEEIVVEE